MAAVQTFLDVYTSLTEQHQETRLIVIEPSSDVDELVECSLATVSLNGFPSYFALPSVWSDATVAETALVNGIY